MSVTISLHVLPAVLAFIVSMVVSIMFFLICSLFSRYQDSKLRQTFNLGLLCLGSAIYILGQVMLNDNKDPGFAIFWHRLEHAGLILVIASYIAFTFSYVGKKYNRIYLIIMALSALLLISLYTTNYFISSETYLYLDKYLQGKEGPLYIVFGATLLFVLTYGYFLLLKNYLSNTVQNSYDRIMIIGIGLAGILGIHDLISVSGYFIFGISTTLFEYGLTIMCISLLYTWVIGKGYFEKHIIEQDLFESRGKIDIISRNMLDIILLFNLDKKVVFASKSAETYFSTTLNSLLKDGINGVFSKENFDKFAFFFNRMAKSAAGILPSEIFVVENSEKEKWLEVVLSQVIGKENMIIGIVAVMRDISERKRLEEELIQSQKLQAVGQLAAGVSHEFNNLLAVIILNAQIAQRRNTLEAHEESFNTILRAGKQAQTVARRLNEFSKKHKLKCRITNIAVCVDETIDLIKKECEKSGIEIVKRYSKARSVLTDGRMLIQVLFNISRNAEQAMVGGGMILFSICETDSCIEIGIKDTGKGITKENINKIFEPFFTTKGASGYGKNSGSGLGLSVSYSIIKSLNGKILVESEEGKGALFKICLPFTGPVGCVTKRKKSKK